jgi:hypothetical protein
VSRPMRCLRASPSHERRVSHSLHYKHEGVCITPTLTSAPHGTTHHIWHLRTARELALNPQDDRANFHRSCRRQR